jgi:hypothetical protein
VRWLGVLLVQEVYQQTHPVLFSERAMYVIVYTLENINFLPDVERHLLNVHVRYKDAPILLVGTHSDVDGGGAPLPLAALKIRFPQVRWGHVVRLWARWAA